MKSRRRGWAMLNNVPPSKSSVDINFHNISIHSKTSKYNKTNRTNDHQEDQNENTNSLRDQPLLLDVACEFISYKKEEIGRDITQSTFRTYLIRLKNLVDYLKKTRQLDILLKDINAGFVKRFERYLLYKRKVSHDHVRRVILQLKQVLDYAQLCEYIEINKISSYKLKRSPQKELVYLSEQELDRLMHYPFSSPVLRKAADLFKIQCWTGLSYCDLMRFSIKNINKDEDNKAWIYYYRKKVKRNEAILPFLPEAEEIMERYSYELPFLDNGTYNRFLKEVADALGINKHLTTHVGRKTFGMIMLNGGISLEVVSKMLGHKSIKTTEGNYAQILKRRMAKEMEHHMIRDLNKVAKLIVLR